MSWLDEINTRMTREVAAPDEQPEVRPVSETWIRQMDERMAEMVKGEEDGPGPDMRPRGPSGSVITSFLPTEEKNRQVKTYPNGSMR